jgi:signal transduction histidine kinase
MKINENEIISKYNLLDFIVDEKSEQLVYQRIELLKQGHKTTNEYTVRDFENRIFQVEARAHLITYENKPSVLVALNDISERKRFEKEIITATIKAEEMERGRIAKELHDGIGPLLSACRIYIHNIKNYNDILESIDNLEELISEAIDSVKEISNNISPHVLRNFGFVQALKNFTEKISKTCHINIDCNCQSHKRYSENIEITIFRVLSELINNTIKHAKAKNIKIDFKEENNSLLIKYFDDGIGFVYDQNIKNKGLGILNMKTRINSIDGKIFFNTILNKGLEVEIQILNL